MADTQKIIEEAISYGFITVPLDGKKPKVKKWTERNLENCKTGFTDGDNVGIVTGKKSGIIGVDIDWGQNGMETMKKWISKHGRPKTPYVITGTDAEHYYFEYEEGFKSASRVLKRKGEDVGIDVKTDGGQLVYPGSIHPVTGKLYRWGISPDVLPPQPMTPWLRKKFMKKQNTPKKKRFIIAKTSEEPDLIASQSLISDLEKHYHKEEKIKTNISKKLVDKAWSFFQSELPSLSGVYKMQDIIGNMVILRRKKSAYCPVCKREHDNENAYLALQGRRLNIKFYCRRDEDNPILLAILHLERDATCEKLLQKHQGPAELIVKKLKGNMEAFDPEGPIYLYEEERCLWKTVPSKNFHTFASSIIIPLYEKKLKLCFAMIKIYKKRGEEDSEECKILKKHISVLESNKYKISDVSFNTSVIAWVLDILCNNPSNIDFNTLTRVLPVKGNLIVNLEDGTTRKRVKEDRFTYEINIVYNPDAHSDFLDKFLAEIMLEDTLPEEQRLKVKFLRRLLGYSCTGECNEQIMVVFTGDEGSNGKSTLCNLIRGCLSPIVTSASKSIMMKKNSSSSANPELDMLRDSRITFVAETQENEFIDEDVFKRMTGGDEVQSRKLYKDFSNWIPQFVPYMITNYVPKCSGDNATIRRILVQKFLAKFVEKPSKPHERKINKNIGKMWTIKEVREAFLAMIVKGAVEYYCEGLNPPEEILNNTAEYRKNMNSLDVFIEQCVDPESDPEDITPFGQIYERYLQTCKEENLIPWSKKKMGDKLVEKYERIRSKGSKYKGIRLLKEERSLILY